MEWILTKLTPFSVYGILLCLLLTVNLWFTIGGSFSALNYPAFLGCFLYFFFNATGSSTYDHSEYNFIVIAIITLLMNFVAANIFCSLKLISNLGYVGTFIIVGGIYLGIPLAFYQINIHNSCEGVWDAGFKNSLML